MEAFGGKKHISVFSYIPWKFGFIPLVAIPKSFHRNLRELQEKQLETYCQAIKFLDC